MWPDLGCSVVLRLWQGSVSYVVVTYLSQLEYTSCTFHQISRVPTLILSPNTQRNSQVLVRHGIRGENPQKAPLLAALCFRSGKLTQQVTCCKVPLIFEGRIRIRIQDALNSEHFLLCFIPFTGPPFIHYGAYVL